MNNFHRNIMGTISFTGKFPGMRKEQGFSVYPMTAGVSSNIRCQSESRWMEIDPNTGAAEITGSESGHHNSTLLMIHRMRGKSKSFTVPTETLSELRSAIASTAGALVGSSFVLSDNSGAATI